MDLGGGWTSDRLLSGMLYARCMSLGGWLQERLFERRIVLITGHLDDGAAARAAAALLALDAGGGRPIGLHPGSPGRALWAAFVLVTPPRVPPSPPPLLYPDPRRRP